jgi:hypothetical protein
MQRPQKITLGEMRSTGLSKVLVFCADYRCSHSVLMSAARWPDDLRLSDLKPLFVCQACGRRGADVRPSFGVDRPSSGIPLTVDARAGESSISINLRAVIRLLERSRFTLIFTDVYWWLP